jgi:hypothetical protein
MCCKTELQIPGPVMGDSGTPLVVTMVRINDNCRRLEQASIVFFFCSPPPRGGGGETGCDCGDLAALLHHDCMAWPNEV